MGGGNRYNERVFPRRWSPTSYSGKPRHPHSKRRLYAREPHPVPNRTASGPESDRAYTPQGCHTWAVRGPQLPHTRNATGPRRCHVTRLQQAGLPHPNRMRSALASAGGGRPIGFACGATSDSHAQRMRPRLFWVQGPVRRGCVSDVAAQHFATSGPHAIHNEFLVG